MDSRYPLGTVALYGPTDKQATKLVAAVIPSANAKPVAMKKWNSEHGDIRESPTVQSELSTFLKENRVAHAVLSEQVLGCPHEEGIDYPSGSACPSCPFWAGQPRRRGVPGQTVAPGRNDPCPCGSGNKYKKCCGA